MKKALSLFLAVLMAVSIFAGLEITALADARGRVSAVCVSGVTEPVAGKKPVFSATTVAAPNKTYIEATVEPTNNPDEGMVNGVVWTDMTTGKTLTANDTFKAGHAYNVLVLVFAKNDRTFEFPGTPDTMSVNGKEAYGTNYYYNGDLNLLHYYISYDFPVLNGWASENGKWYFYANGDAVTGWKAIGGKWYFFDSKGVMATGWVKSGGKWYFLDKKNGDMKTGWVKDGSTWYYMNSSGAMTTGWQKVSGVWYYMNSSGAMQTGWLKQSGKWYYLESSGKMLANTSKKIGSKTYKFNSSGVCTNP